jgi:hypothetical protein
VALPDWLVVGCSVWCCTGTMTHRSHATWYLRLSRHPFG